MTRLPRASRASAKDSDPQPRLRNPRIGGDFATDVYETHGSVVVLSCMPGVRPENVRVSIRKNLLTIAGSREEETDARYRDYSQKEIRRGSFTRTVSLPSSVDAARAEARYEEGILSIVLPRLYVGNVRVSRVPVLKALE